MRRKRSSVPEKRPKIVWVKPYSCQPKKAELEADVSVPTTPEKLAREMVQPVEVREEA